MNKEEILALEPGNDLSIILEKVFGFKHLIGDDVPQEHYDLGARGPQEIWLNQDGHRYCKWCGDYPNYSENIADAWEVFNFMLNKSFMERMKYYVALQEIANGVPYPETLVVLKDKMPEAICKAALLVSCVD